MSGTDGLEGGQKEDPVRDIVIFSGSAHRELAERICGRLGVALSATRVTRFGNDCLQVQLHANCREADVFVIQPLSPPVHEHLMELLLMLDAARGASAARATAVIPFFSYARSDKKDAPRISIAARLVADLLVTAGATRILTMTMHAPQVHGFFNVPLDHLHALSVLAEHFKDRDLDDTVVVSPDLGRAREAAHFARLLRLPVAAGSKRRLSDRRVVIDAIIGDVDKGTAIVIDDEIATGSTVFTLLDLLRDRGVRKFAVICTHGVFGAGALDRFREQHDIAEIVTTDTVPLAPDKRLLNLHVLSVAPLLAETIRRIHEGESVSSLFTEPDQGEP